MIASGLTFQNIFGKQARHNRTVCNKGLHNYIEENALLLLSILWWPYLSYLNQSIALFTLEHFTAVTETTYLQSWPTFSGTGTKIAFAVCICVLDIYKQWP